MKNYCPKEWALEIISEEEYEMLNKLAEEKKKEGEFIWPINI